MQSLLQDVRLGLRILGKNPGSTFAIVAILSLGVGTTTAIFSLVDATLLRKLPAHHPEELVRMVRRLPKIGTYSEFPYAYYQALRDRTKTLAAAFGETKYSHFSMTDPGPAEDISVHGVTPEYFQGLGVNALYGRALMPADDTGTSDTPPAVLSYGFWQRRFHGDRAVVAGQTLLINGSRFAVVGVMPRSFNGFTVDTSPDVRIPFRALLRLENSTPDQIVLEVAGRVRPEFTRLQTEAECRVLWQATMRDYLRDVRRLPPEAASRELSRGMGLDPLERGLSVVRDRYGDTLKVLMASVGVLVVLVCANVAGLLLARSAARQREMALRIALGATRWQLARQILAEGILLATPSIVGGLAVALAGMRISLRLLPPIRDISTSLVAVSVDMRVDWRVFLFLLSLTLATVLVSSIAPALTVSRTNLDSLLRAVRSTRNWRARKLLIAFQLALCTFLLAIASLFVRTFQQLRHTDPGFDSDHIATFTIRLSDKAGGPALLRTFAERVRELPGVVSVAWSNIGVMRERGASTTVAPMGQRLTSADFLNTNLNKVSPDFFSTMGMQILAGRGFVAADVQKPNATAPEMAVVNEAFARRFFPNTDPMGKRFGSVRGMEGIADGRYEVAGVVSDAKYRSLREPIRPMLYTLESGADQLVVYVRTRMQPEGIIEPVRKTLAELDPAVPFLEVHTMVEEVDNSAAGERVTAALASLFAVIAAMLAGTGIHALLVYIVAERRNEIGIRMALGARSTQIGELIARQILTVTAAGITLGLAGALAAGRGISTLLYGVAPGDPKALAAAAAFVAVTTVAATIVPVLRATRADPTAALRCE